jgi:lipopolysaccharide/colanic/teichoic acid biosynthesis glycosyltransferase
VVREKAYKQYSCYLDSWGKRCLDIIICGLLLPPSLIIMGLASLYILIREGRPVFFTHYRVGKNGTLFLLPKLRTFRTDADPYKPPTDPDKDQWITITGTPLRKYRVDELPQLFLVLTGCMSMVGPRPELANVVDKYKHLERKRLLIKPGITGLWQIMRGRSNKLGMDVKYDLYYLRRASLWLDVQILVKTISFILNPE